MLHNFISLLLKYYATTAEFDRSALKTHARGAAVLRKHVM
jgi:hypothetical protein